MTGANCIDISVVVVTYNRAGMLQNALTTLVNQMTEDRFSLEILVIDDGSTDITETAQSFADNHTRPVRYIHKEHGGEGRARNKGVLEARGEWLAFFDDDQLAAPLWLTELYKVAQEMGADCVDGPVFLMLPDSCPLQLGQKSRRVLGEKIFSQSNGQHPGKEYVGAGNVLIRKSLFEQVGLFDVTFRQGVDEDFFRRLQKGGFRFCYSPQAVAYHVIPPMRLQRAYLRETCLRMAVAHTRVRLKYEGALRLALLTSLRVGVALGRDIPLLLLAGMLNDEPLNLDSRCGIWYTLGLIRGSLFYLAPNLFPQKRFISSLDFHYLAGFLEDPSAQKVT